MDLWMGFIGIVFCFFLLRGVIRGFSGEVAPLLGLAVAVAVLWFGYKPLHSAAMLVVAESAGDAAAFYSALAVVVAGVVVYLAIAYLARGVISFILPQPFNAILGGVVGAAKGLFLISAAASVVWMVRDRADRFQQLRADNPVFASATDFWADRLRGAAADALEKAAPPAEDKPAEEGPDAGR